MGKSLKLNFIIVAVLMMCLCLFAISFLTLYTMESIIVTRFNKIGKYSFNWSLILELFLIIEHIVAGYFFSIMCDTAQAIANDFRDAFMLVTDLSKI